MIGLLPLCVEGSAHLSLAQARTVTRADVDRLLNTKNPIAHCTQRHNHADDNFEDWRGSLAWSASDCGHNEGAAAVLKLAAGNGLSYPELMTGCRETEDEISIVDQAMKDPSKLDYALRGLPGEKRNELKDAIKHGNSFVEILVKAVDAQGGEVAVGEVWRRRAMMRFASKLAVNGKSVPATAIAVASQWHNCHAFRCLLRHTPEVALWLPSGVK
jgi:hypothetical protein